MSGGDRIKSMNFEILKKNLSKFLSFLETKKYKKIKYKK